ncbi:hypothetical protein [Bacteroides caecimuris]|uniref:hypothetical protein n=1 Tax=Bacteroides caecimuris TaxID=1796613 RepID=UPI001C3D99DE|nr:hypothetical protein [Bacteroides caecimuris]
MGRISGITGADGTDKTVSGHFVKQNLHRSDGSDERRSDWRQPYEAGKKARGHLQEMTSV